MVFRTKKLQEITDQLYELKFQGEITTKAQIEDKLLEVVAYERLRILHDLRDLSLSDVPLHLYLGMLCRAIISPKKLINYTCKVALNYARLVVEDKNIPETLHS